MTTNINDQRVVTTTAQQNNHNRHTTSDTQTSGQIPRLEAQRILPLHQQPTTNSQEKHPTVRVTLWRGLR